MYILDTDHLSILDQDTHQAANVARRLESVTPQLVWVTVITYEEQMRGWMAYVAGANTPERQATAYRKLRKHIDRFCHIPLLDYDEAAVEEMGHLKQARIRVGTMDLKIAAIALARDATLLTRNTAHFAKVPGLRIENWAD